MFKFFLTKHEKKIRDLKPLISDINKEYVRLSKLSHDELRAETLKLRSVLFDGIKQERRNYEEAKSCFKKNKSFEKKIIDNLQINIEKTFKVLKKKKEEVLLKALPTAFAIVKDTARRFTENEKIEVKVTDYDKTLFEKGKSYVDIRGDVATWSTTWNVMEHPIKWNMIHYDEQLIGGIVLHQGKIAEMATGEGKTLVSTLPIFLNALLGEGVHIVTVNDYLARRDCMWNGPLYEFHGLSVACIDDTMAGSDERKKAYLSDITYGTNSEFGFDYLRDNMAYSVDQIVQRGHVYAIIDEIDSVLIDEARTPLIISSSSDNENIKDYSTFQPFVKRLYDEQLRLVNKLLSKVKDDLSKGIKDNETGIALLRAYRGLPKNDDLIAILGIPGVEKFKNEVEGIYMENNYQRMPEIDKELFFHIDDRLKNVELTDKGFDFISKQVGNSDFFTLPDFGIEIGNIEKNSTLSFEEKEICKKIISDNYVIKSKRIHVIQQLLKAYTLLKRDDDYIVTRGAVRIIDKQTGRQLEGRRYSDGLHQALEAKEFVEVQKSSQTYATITLQNYFRKYDKLAGMTGTAETESAEFLDIYNLDVVIIPTHKPMIREDKDDSIYKTKYVKNKAIIDRIIELSKLGRPVLVGTTSVESSERLSSMLKARKIPHQVLNAKYHQQEAEIIAKAGISGTVTIATNMAGRGTDIKLDEKAIKAGGLAIIGSERHESRRVDMQLCGRAGRQGDPGSSEFYLSLEDDLIFGMIGDRNQRVAHAFGDDEKIVSGLFTRVIRSSQNRIEENNRAVRKHLIEYDNVLNIQREKIYSIREKFLKEEIVFTDIYRMLMYIVKEYILVLYNVNDQLEYEDVKNKYSSLTNCDFFENSFDFYDETYNDIFQKTCENLFKIYENRCIEIYKKLRKDLEDRLKDEEENTFRLTVGMLHYIVDIDIDLKKFKTFITENTDEKSIGEYIIISIISKISINFIDKYWQEHLMRIEDLKTAVQNAYYEQKDPLLVFKFESFKVFKSMIIRIYYDIMEFIFKCKTLNKEEKDKYLSELKKDESDYAKEILYRDIFHQMKKKMKVLMN